MVYFKSQQIPIVFSERIVYITNVLRSITQKIYSILKNIQYYSVVSVWYGLAIFESLGVFCSLK